MRNILLAGTSALLLLCTISSAAGAMMTCNPTLKPRADKPQVNDENFTPEVSVPAYRPGSGAKIHIDEAHNNYHTMNGRYKTFATLLRQDGFVVEPFVESFSDASLADVEVLVIANPIHKDDMDAGASLPVQSAFTEAEIVAVEAWVSNGGSLFLIADHMPIPGAVMDLAQRFGIQMTNSYATDATCSEDEFLFTRTDGTLADHPVTEGRSEDERIDYVRSITGQAFWLTVPGEPIMYLPPRSVVLLPSEPWNFSDATPRIPGDGLLQGATIRHSKGRIAVFGEAAMFSAQVSGPKRRPMGMNMPSAAQNGQFLLNVMHWLVDLIPPK